MSEQLIREARSLRALLHLRGATDEADSIEALTDALEAAEATIARLRALCDNPKAGPLYEHVVRAALDPVPADATPDVFDTPCDECGFAPLACSCRCPASPRRVETAELANELAGLIQDTTDDFVPLSARYGLADAILAKFTVTPRAADGEVSR